MKLCTECNKRNQHSIDDEGEYVPYFDPDLYNCTLCIDCCIKIYQGLFKDALKEEDQ